MSVMVVPRETRQLLGRSVRTIAPERKPIADATRANNQTGCFDRSCPTHRTSDIRSNEVVEKPLVIARMWIADRTAPPLFVAAQPAAFLDAGIHDVARVTVRPRVGVGQPHRELVSLRQRKQRVTTIL
jgi:hypothetical protein